MNRVAGKQHSQKCESDDSFANDFKPEGTRTVLLKSGDEQAPKGFHVGQSWMNRESNEGNISPATCSDMCNG